VGWDGINIPKMESSSHSHNLGPSVAWSKQQYNLETAMGMGSSGKDVIWTVRKQIRY